MNISSLSLRFLGAQICMLGLSTMASQAEFTWAAPNVSDDASIIYAPFEEELGGPNAMGDLKFLALEDMNNPASPRAEVTPTLVPGPKNLGKAVKLDPNNILLSGYLPLTPPGEFTLSFWVQISQPGFLGRVSYSGPNPEENFGIDLKAMPNGMLRCGGVLGKSFEKSEACDVADGSWHHLALTVKPEESGASSSVKVWLDGNNIIDTTAPGVAGGKCLFGVGASFNAFTVPSFGPGAEMLVDDLLFENQALEKPNTALKK